LTPFFDLIPDYDRNGTIDINDFNRLRSGELFRFWVNDDDFAGGFAFRSFQGGFVGGCRFYPALNLPGYWDAEMR
jgi:hypothetical protein